MSLLKKFNQAFGFTPSESRVVLFLVAAFVVGIGIKVYRTTLAPPPTFDYSKSDSEFAARSQLLATAESLQTAADGERGAGLQSSRQAATAAGVPRSGRINLNTATKAELESLPGIGEAMAERIMIYREENGSFRSLDDLMHVKGIGRKKLERLAPYCTVEK